MKYVLMLIACCAFCLALVPSASAQDVPKGKITEHRFDQSEVFPGTTRRYWVYVPAQYDGSEPACVHVSQDGIQFNAPAVFDELIASGEMPVTVGVFVEPGVVPAANGNALPRYNRSYEYDTVSDDYATFLLDELLPAVEEEQGLNLSHDGNDRSITGNSSGAICAFTAAWYRPDAFSRVFTGVGTFVGLRGGDELATLVRKTEPKPIRIFMCDGTNDLNIYCGDWWMANQTMQRALAFSGYQVEHRWDNEGHNDRGGKAAFPDAMRYLWKGYPARVEAGRGSPQMRELLIEGEGWEADKPTGRPSGVYTIERHAGGGYATGLSSSGDPGRVWYVDARKQRSVVDTGLGEATGVTLSPDQTLLYVADAKTRWVYSYQVQGDGSLRYKQKYYHLHTPIEGDGAEAGGMCVDRGGRLYVATNMGVQVCDQPGRVNCILPMPGNAAATDVRFDGDTLVVTCGEQVYRRKLKVSGVDSTAEPIKPPRPGL